MLLDILYGSAGMLRQFSANGIIYFHNQPFLSIHQASIPENSWFLTDSGVKQKTMQASYNAASQ